MSPDDPRHGQNRGYIAGCRDQCCRDAHALYRRNLRSRAYLARVTSLQLDGVGTRRRLQALMALGWSTRTLDQMLGKRPSYSYRILSARGTVYRTTATAVAELYERLCMTTPAATTEPARAIIRRNAASAASHGYAPPLAWDDIDRDEAPTGIYAKPTNQSEWMVEHTAKRAADLEHAVDLGWTLEQAADNLSLSAEAVEVWCKRRGRTDVLEALRKRSRDRAMGAVA